jgi:hypothetical protein
LHHFFLQSFRYVFLPFCFSVGCGWTTHCDLYVLTGCTVCHLPKCTRPDNQSVVIPCYFFQAQAAAHCKGNVHCSVCMFVHLWSRFLLYSRQLLWRRLKIIYSFYFLIFVTNDLRTSLIELLKYFT